MSYFLEVDSKGNKKNIGPPSLEDWKNDRTLVKLLKILHWDFLAHCMSYQILSSMNWFTCIQTCCNCVKVEIIF